MTGLAIARILRFARIVLSQTHQIEVSSVALERFLAPDFRKLEGEESLSRLKSAFADDAPLAWPKEEYLPQRILVLWRTSRLLARITGICAEDELLDSATELHPSPWTNPLKPRLTPGQQNILRKTQASALLACLADGLPLLPPQEHGVHAALAQQWCDAMKILARDLLVHRTEYGLQGLEGLLDPRTCGYAGVTEEHVLALEELFVDEAQKLLIECGERPAIEHFRLKYGFTKREATELIRLARVDALLTGASSVDEDRAIMVANLKDLVARAKEEMSSDRELKALKLLATIQGLTRTEPEDMARDFMRVIASVAMRQDASHALPPLEAVAQLAQYTVLNGHEVPEVPEEDSEAVLQFDEERLHG